MLIQGISLQLKLQPITDVEDSVMCVLLYCVMKRFSFTSD